MRGEIPPEPLVDGARLVFRRIVPQREIITPLGQFVSQSLRHHHLARQTGRKQARHFTVAARRVMQVQNTSRPADAMLQIGTECCRGRKLSRARRQFCEQPQAPGVDLAEKQECPAFAGLERWRVTGEDMGPETDPPPQKGW